MMVSLLYVYMLKYNESASITKMYEIAGTQLDKKKLDVYGAFILATSKEAHKSTEQQPQAVTAAVSATLQQQQKKKHFTAQVDRGGRGGFRGGRGGGGFAGFGGRGGSLFAAPGFHRGGRYW
jgi:hypothetical protein